MSDKTLEQVLEELKQAEKEYKEKCLKYGIEEKVKRKKKDDNLEENPQEVEPNQNAENKEESSEN